MFTFFITFFISFCISIFLVKNESWHIRWSKDFHDMPQKIHYGVRSRIGGVAIFLAVLSCGSIFFVSIPMYTYTFSYIFFSGIPIFLIGLIEDTTKKINFLIRLLISIISASMFLFFLDVPIIGVDIDIIDNILFYPLASFLFLSIAISGLCHAYNLIDGLNGLASMIGILSLLVILFVSNKVNDLVIIHFCLMLTGAILGFFLLNYPSGLLFLGDGGAYLIGFWVASLSILLVIRNPDVSPWFALTLNSYAVFETLFSIWRRLNHKKRKVMMPDFNHLHSLIFRRVMCKKFPNNSEKSHQLSNSKASIYLWLLSSIGFVSSALFWNSTPVLLIACIIFAAIYIYIYLKIIHFKTPMWLFIL